MKYQTYTIFSDWTPTVEAINALPEPLRRYIMNLETRCDPAGETRERILIAEENAMLRKKLADIMPPHFEEFQRQIDNLAESLGSGAAAPATF